MKPILTSARTYELPDGNYSPCTINNDSGSCAPGTEVLRLDWKIDPIVIEYYAVILVRACTVLVTIVCIFSELARCLLQVLVQSRWMFAVCKCPYSGCSHSSHLL